MKLHLKILYIGFIILLQLPLSLYAQKPDLVFGLIADAQYGDYEPNIGRYYRNSLDKLTESTEYLNARNVDFTVNLGDLIDRDWNDMERPLERLSRLHRKVYHLTGNHDYKGTPDNQVLYERLAMPGVYYTLRKGNWILVMLNTNEVSAYAHFRVPIKRPS